jgi:hypothetical protein
MLYLGATVRDQAVWGIDNFDQWDGIRFIINDREERDVSNHNLVARQFTAHIDTMGQFEALDFLAALIDSNAASFAGTLTGATTANDFNDVDEGYVIEMAVDLTECGYPDGLGDGVLFFSATLFDGDKVNDNPDDDYGNRVWFYREHAGNAGPAWAYMDPEAVITGLTDRETGVPIKFEIIGNYPNPFNPSTSIKYALPAAGSVKINVFNVLGQIVFTKELGPQTVGYKNYEFNASRLSSGLYFYNIELHSAGTTRTTAAEKMLLIK